MWPVTAQITMTRSAPTNAQALPENRRSFPREDAKGVLHPAENIPLVAFYPRLSISWF